MKINLQVKPDELAKPDFQKVLLQACDDLSLEKVVRKFCLHEVGHLLYFEPIRKLIGDDTPELEFVGPMISFNVIEGKYQHTPAAVRTPFAECGMMYTETILQHLARGAVAGGIILELENYPDIGDSGDRDVFHQHFLLARGQRVTPKRTEDKMWEKAQECVRVQLQADGVMAHIRLWAEQLQKDHFSL